MNPKFVTQKVGNLQPGDHFVLPTGNSYGFWTTLLTKLARGVYFKVEDEYREVNVVDQNGNVEWVDEEMIVGVVKL